MSAPKPMSFWTEHPFRAPAFVVLTALLVHVFQRMSLDYILHVNLRNLYFEMDRLKTLETMVGQGIVDLKAVMDSMHSSRVTSVEFLWITLSICFFLFVVGIDARAWSGIKDWCRRKVE